LNQSEISTALVLAAGRGSRLGPMGILRPKGLVEVAGVSLIDRSISCLRSSGVSTIHLVAGHRIEDYIFHFRGERGVYITKNADYETTGSFESLVRGLKKLSGPVFILESDIIYEPRALRELSSSSAKDVILTSGETLSSDEVWVSVDSNNRVLKISKTLPGLPEFEKREFVGISKISDSLRTGLINLYENDPDYWRNQEYEVAIEKMAELSEVYAHRCEDLIWGEVDTLEQLDRVTRLFTNK
jgi:choline kinase